MAFIRNTLITILLVNYVCCQSTNKRYILCASELQAKLPNCQGLNSVESEVNCIATTDSNDCALKLKSGEADFAVFTAEQMALVSSIINDNTEVVFRVDETSGQQVKFRMGVVVKDNLSLTTIRGKNYCHPGFDTDIRHNRIMKVFESKVVTPQCLPDKLTVENELDSISSFFGNYSCRPGSWTADDDQEFALRRKYNSLCAICDDTYSCTNNRPDSNHHFSALSCLTEKVGQVAYVSIAETKEYFKSRDSSKYSFLCPDDTRMSIDVDQPCSWYEEPYDGVVAVSNKADAITAMLRSSSARGIDWSANLKSILMPNGGQLTLVSAKPSDYAKNITDSVKNSSCGRNIKWCTASSAEKSKCDTLKRASALNGIEPELTCVQANNIAECLNRTKHNETDILGIDTSLAYVAYRHFDVQPVKYQDSGADDLYKTVAVSRSGTITTFQDLVKRDLCFPEFGSLAHITIYEEMKAQNILQDCVDICKATCVPRLMQIPRDTNSSDKFCSLHDGKNCYVDVARSADVRAIQCLINNNNGVAFINANSIKSIRENPVISTQFVEGQYRFLCKNGQEMFLNQAVDESCSYGSFLSGLIVGSKSLSSVHVKDIDLALQKMDSLFGIQSTWLFKMYGTYAGVSNLLFKGQTVALASNSNKYVTEFEKVMDSVTKCSGAPGIAASSNIVISLTVSLSIFVVLLHKY